MDWEDVRVGGNDPIAKKVSAKLASSEALMSTFGGVRLRMELDKHLWQDRNHVTVAELCEWFPRYLYLQRLKDRETIIEAVKDGASRITVEDTFAFADGIGSFVLISAFVVDAELDYDEPIFEVKCPTGCAACLEACPTGALYEPLKMDPRLCIAFNTFVTPRTADEASRRRS